MKKRLGCLNLLILVLLIQAVCFPIQAQDTLSDSGSLLKLEIYSNSQWLSQASASIGETLSYRALISVNPENKNYILKDTMPDGITFSGLTSVECNQTALEAENYTFVSETSSNSFTVAFSQDFITSLDCLTPVVITYQAQLNEDAAIQGLSGTNSTTALLYYTDNGRLMTAGVQADVNTYKVQIAQTDANNIVLDGAAYALYKDGTLLSLVDNGNSTYTLAGDQKAGTVYELSAGLTTLYGLGSGSYTLVPIKAPEGYVFDESQICFQVDNASNICTITPSAAQATSLQDIWSEGGIHIASQKEVTLPEAGSHSPFWWNLAAALCIALGLSILLFQKKRI